MVQNVAPSSVVFPRQQYYLRNCLFHSVPRMYADDTHLTYSNGNIHSIQSSLNENLRNINRWLTANKLTLNMTKTECMLIGSS